MPNLRNNLHVALVAHSGSIGTWAQCLRSFNRLDRRQSLVEGDWALALVSQTAGVLTGGGGGGRDAGFDSSAGVNRCAARVDLS